jgi:hypothetical protein
MAHNMMQDIKILYQCLQERTGYHIICVCGYIQIIWGSGFLHAIAFTLSSLEFLAVSSIARPGNHMVTDTFSAAYIGMKA